MDCPICSRTMHKRPGTSASARSRAMQCPHCQFVIYYRQVDGLNG